MTEEHYRADTLDITFDVNDASLEETVNALCDKAEQMVRNGTVLLVLSDRNIAKTVCRCLRQWRWVLSRRVWWIRACAAMPTSLLKPPAPATRTTLPCC